MSHAPTESSSQLVELSDLDLAHVTGGFLPLLGLLGPIAGIAGQIMDGIGKKKTQQAQQLTSQSQGQGGGSSAGGGSSDGSSGGGGGSAAGGTDLMSGSCQGSGS